MNSEIQYLWVPCSPIDKLAQTPPPRITEAQGSYLTLANGKKIIDGISSWWCKSLGHQHPRLKAALIAQAKKFEHVMVGHMVNEPLLALSEKLATLFHPLNKVHYASDGSSAIEIAMKMSLHAQQLSGHPQRTQWLALENSYHGETGLSLAVTGNEKYRQPYQIALPKAYFLQNLPYLNHKQDSVWTNIDSDWPKLLAQLSPIKDHLAAVILEPIVQGAGGMKIYSQDLLKKLREWTEKNHIYLIADEIMTGFGRTGSLAAYQHAEIIPDFVCLGKGLTAGWLPMSAVLTHSAVFDLFSGGNDPLKTFWHSHTYGGNALAAAVALETLRIYEEENIYSRIQTEQSILYENMLAVAEQTQCLREVRQFGWMAAADLIVQSPNAGFKVFQQALAQGALLRPLGNTIYWLPPLNCKHQTLEELTAITIKAIQAAKNYF